jgi:glycosyltransferase involved in cell wall biosynthesis
LIILIDLTQIYIVINAKKKKIVHILYSGLGGHGSDFFSLIDLNVKNHFKVIPIFYGIEEINPDYIEKCKSHNLNYYFFKKKIGVDYQATKNVINTLLRIKPQIICLHSGSAIFIALLYKVLNRKVTLILRDTQAPHLKTKTEQILLFIAYLTFSKLVFLTLEARDSLAGKFGAFFQKKKCLIIPNGVDITLHKKTNHKLNSGLIVIGMQSRLQVIKDHPTLIKAFALVIEKYPELKLQLKIAGDGDTMDNLIEIVNKLNLADKILFVGMLTEIQLSKFMQELNIYVHSTFGEALSTSILQAMCYSLPIVASDVQGVNNLLTNNTNCLLYQSKDADELAQKIIFLIENPIIAKRLGDTARNEIENNYSSTIMRNRYKALFNDIVK